MTTYIDLHLELEEEDLNNCVNLETLLPLVTSKLTLTLRMDRKLQGKLEYGYSLLLIDASFQHDINTN